MSANSPQLPRSIFESFCEEGVWQEIEDGFGVKVASVFSKKYQQRKRELEKELTLQLIAETIFLDCRGEAARFPDDRGGGPIKTADGRLELLKHAPWLRNDMIQMANDIALFINDIPEQEE